MGKYLTVEWLKARPYIPLLGILLGGLLTAGLVKWLGDIVDDNCRKIGGDIMYDGRCVKLIDVQIGMGLSLHH